jgi:hypothetical protein
MSILKHQPVPLNGAHKLPPASPTATSTLLLLEGHGCWYFLVQRQDVGYRANWCDRGRVDLLVALGVVVLDVCEFRRAAKGVVLPVQVTDPPVRMLVIAHRE